MGTTNYIDRAFALIASKNQPFTTKQLCREVGLPWEDARRIVLRREITKAIASGALLVVGQDAEGSQLLIWSSQPEPNADPLLSASVVGAWHTALYVGGGVPNQVTAERLQQVLHQELGALINNEETRI